MWFHRLLPFAFYFFFTITVQQLTKQKRAEGLLSCTNFTVYKSDLCSFGHNRSILVQTSFVFEAKFYVCVCFLLDGGKNRRIVGLLTLLLPSLLVLWDVTAFFVVFMWHLVRKVKVLLCCFTLKVYNVFFLTELLVSHQLNVLHAKVQDFTFRLLHVKEDSLAVSLCEQQQLQNTWREIRAGEAARTAASLLKHFDARVVIHSIISLHSKNYLFIQQLPIVCL